MKRFCLLLAASALLASCALEPYLVDQREAYMDDYLEKRFTKRTLFKGPFPDVRVPADIVRYLQNHIAFRTVDAVRDPEEIFASGYGDCESYALGYANIAYVQFGIKCDVSVVKYDPALHIEKGTMDVDHAVVRYPDGTIIEPQTGKRKAYEVCYWYSFDEVFPNASREAK